MSASSEEGWMAMTDRERIACRDRIDRKEVQTADEKERVRENDGA